MRRPERSPHHERLARRQQARHAVDARDLDGLVGRERRHDARQTPREHRLARAGRAGQEHVVRPGHGHLEGALHAGLADDVGEVGVAGRRRGQQPVQIRGRRRFAAARLDLRTASCQRRRRIHFEPRHQRGLRRVAGREHEAAHAAPVQALRQGERSGDRSQAAVEPQLADGRQRPAAVAAVAHLPGREQERERDGQVERRPLLADVRRGQIDRDAPRGELVRRVDDRGAHPLATLLHGRVGQTDDAERRRRRHHVGLHHHRVALEAAQGLTGDSREHAASLVVRPPSAAEADLSSVERERAGQVTHGRRSDRSVDGHDVEAHVARRRAGPTA